MKKKVRIYKSENGVGKVLNKTAQFLNKAQGGGQQDTGYNQAVLEFVAAEILQKDTDPQEVYQKLIESKLDPDNALKHIQAIIEYRDQMASSEQQPMDPQAQAQVAGEDQQSMLAQAAADAEDQLAAQNATNYGYYDSSGVAKELSNDDTGEEDDYDDVEEDQMAQEGGIAEYMPARNIPNFLDSRPDDIEALSKGGTPSKRSFMNNVMKELKKARKGQSMEDTTQEFDSTDSLTLDRKKQLSGFIGGIKRTTQAAQDKAKAEEMWQQQQQVAPDPSISMLNRQVGGPAMGTDPSEYTHYTHGEDDIFHDQMNEMFTARGGMAMPSPREYRKMHRAVSRMLPNIYMDPNIQGSELSVHKTNWLGRPKEYDIKFQGNQGIMPSWGHGTLMIGLPGGSNMGWGNNWGGSSSYTSGKKAIIETTKVRREGVIRDINKQADPDPKGQSNVDKVVGDQSKVVKDQSGNPIISDGSNMQWNDPGTNMPIQVQQMGGFADPASMDPSMLSKFIYGGMDPEIDDTNTINTADPYFGRMYKEGGMLSFEPGGEYDTWLQDQAKQQALDEYNAYMNRSGTKVKYDANENDSVYKQILDKKLAGVKSQSNDNSGVDQQKLIDEAINKRMAQFNPRAQQQQQTTYGQTFDPRMRSNGFLDQLFTGNVTPNYLGTWSKLKGLETSNGMPFTGFDANTSLSNLKVTKSGRFGRMRGVPKEYELTFNKRIPGAGIPGKQDDIKIKEGPDGKPIIDNKTVVDEKNIADENAKPRKSVASQYGYGEDDWDNLTWQQQTDIMNSPDNNRNMKTFPMQPMDVKNPQSSTLRDFTGPENPKYTGSGMGAMERLRMEEEGSLEPGVNNYTIQGNSPKYPKGTRSYSGMDSAYEPEQITPNSYDARTVRPAYNSLYEGNQRSSTGIESTPDMSQPDALNATGIAPANKVPQRVVAPQTYSEENDPLNQMPMAYGGYIPDYMAYGGDIIHLPLAYGGNNPVVYTDNPAFVGKSNIDLLNEHEGMKEAQGLNPSSFWGDQASFNQPTMDYQTGCTEEEKQDPKSACYDMEKYGMKTGPTDAETAKTDSAGNQEIKMKMKNKNVTEVPILGQMLAANNLVGRGVNISNNRETSILQNKKKENRTSNNVYASNAAGDPFKKTGAYSVAGSTYGLFDPKNSGAINNSGGAQKGGSIYKEGGVTYMTKDQIKEFMAAGGQIEYIK